MKKHSFEIYQAILLHIEQIIRLSFSWSCFRGSEYIFGMKSQAAAKVTSSSSILYPRIQNGTLDYNAIQHNLGKLWTFLTTFCQKHGGLGKNWIKNDHCVQPKNPKFQQNAFVLYAQLQQSILHIQGLVDGFYNFFQNGFSVHIYYQVLFLTF